MFSSLVYGTGVFSVTSDDHPADYLGGLDDGPGTVDDEIVLAWTDDEDDEDGADVDAGDVVIGDEAGAPTDGHGDAELFDAPAEFDAEDVAQFLHDEPSDDVLRPALRRLTTDQRDLIASFVDGFQSRSAVVEWCQDAAIRTLGELPGEWMQARVNTRMDLSVLVVSDARERYRPESGELLSPRQAAGVRRGVVLSDVLPACRSAYRRLRWSATEYVQDHDDNFVPDPEVQDHTAMRPALTELDERQDWAIRRLLSGLPSEDALLAWLQAVTEASAAEIPDELGQRLNRERRARRYLLDDVEDGDRDTALWFRESFAAEYVLPAFSRATAEVGTRAGELAEKENSGLNVPDMG